MIVDNAQQQRDTTTTTTNPTNTPQASSTLSRLIHRLRNLSPVQKAFISWFIINVFFVGLFNAWRASDIPDDDDALALLMQQQQRQSTINQTNEIDALLLESSTATKEEAIQVEEFDEIQEKDIAQDEDDEEDDEDVDDEEDDDEEDDDEDDDIPIVVEMKEERQPRIIEEEIVEVELPDPYANEQEEMEWTLEDLESALGQLESELFQQVEQQLSVAEDSLRVILDQTVTIPSTTTASTSTMLESTQQLLALESLSQLSDEELQEYFSKAREELEFVMANNQTVPWSQIQAVLNQSYHRSENKTANATTNGCPAPVLSDLNQSIARDTDLARQIQDAQRWLQSLSQDLLNAPVLRKQQRQWEQAISEMALQARGERNVILAQEIEKKNRGQNCISQEQVIEMVEEGLAVLYQEDDVNALRTVLEQKTKSLEPDAQVILDAIFLPKQQRQQPSSSSSSRLSTTLTKSQHFTFRQLLDTPIVSQQVPLWLDWLEKVVGGRFDMVDNLLDWVMQQPPPPSVNAAAIPSNKITLGHLMVAHVLNQAGKFNVTNILERLRQLPADLTAIVKRGKRVVE